MRLSQGLRRRTVLAALPALALSETMACPSMAATPDFASIERKTGGKLGVYVLDTGSNRAMTWRADQRFPFCSSFKALLAAMVLAEADAGKLRLDQNIAYSRADLLDNSPVTAKHLDVGRMPIGELCAAAVAYSDNGAANLLLKQVGGPAALTAWLRGDGDRAFDLSHNEPLLNVSLYGEARDTTTPQAMAASFQRLLFGAVLSAKSKAKLADWMIATTTGGKRIRAGLPQGWRVGDKTGTSGAEQASTIDIAVIWPPGRSPVIVSGFVTGATSTAAGEAALAEIGRQTAAWVIASG
jgi:beta-lactamase class A